jgi:hypothetical protein
LSPASLSEAPFSPLSTVKVELYFSSGIEATRQFCATIAQLCTLHCIQFKLHSVSHRHWLETGHNNVPVGYELVSEAQHKSSVFKREKDLRHNNSTASAVNAHARGTRESQQLVDNQAVNLRGRSLCTLTPWTATHLLQQLSSSTSTSTTSSISHRCALSPLWSSCP